LHPEEPLCIIQPSEVAVLTNNARHVHHSVEDEVFELTLLVYKFPVKNLIDQHEVAPLGKGRQLHSAVDLEELHAVCACLPGCQQHVAVGENHHDEAHSIRLFTNKVL
jgi:hypothetical protein